MAEPNSTSTNSSTSASDASDAAAVLEALAFSPPPKKLPNASSGSDVATASASYDKASSSRSDALTDMIPKKGVPFSEQDGTTHSATLEHPLIETSDPSKVGGGVVIETPKEDIRVPTTKSAPSTLPVETMPSALTSTFAKSFMTEVPDKHPALLSHLVVAAATSSVDPSSADYPSVEMHESSVSSPSPTFKDIDAAPPSFVEDTAPVIVDLQAQRKPDDVEEILLPSANMPNQFAPSIQSVEAKPSAPVSVVDMTDKHPILPPVDLVTASGELAATPSFVPGPSSSVSSQPAPSSESKLPALSGSADIPTLSISASNSRPAAIPATISIASTTVAGSNQQDHLRPAPSSPSASLGDSTLASNFRTPAPKKGGCDENNYSAHDANAFLSNFNCDGIKQMLKGYEVKVFVASPEEPLLTEDTPEPPKTPSPQNRSVSVADREKRAERSQRKLKETQDAHELGTNALAMMIDYTANKMDEGFTTTNTNIERNGKKIDDLKELFLQSLQTKQDGAADGGSEEALIDYIAKVLIAKQEEGVPSRDIEDEMFLHIDDNILPAARERMREMMASRAADPSSIIPQPEPTSDNAAAGVEVHLNDQGRGRKVAFADMTSDPVVVPVHSDPQPSQPRRGPSNGGMEIANAENAGVPPTPRLQRTLLSTPLTSTTNANRRTTSAKLSTANKSALAKQFRAIVSQIGSKKWKEKGEGLGPLALLCDGVDGFDYEHVLRFMMQKERTALMLLCACLEDSRSKVSMPASKAVISFARMACRNERPLKDTDALSDVSNSLEELAAVAIKLSGNQKGESFSRDGTACVIAISSAAAEHTYLKVIDVLLSSCVDTDALKNMRKMIALSTALLIIVEGCDATAPLLNMKKRGETIVTAVKLCIEHGSQYVRSNGEKAYIAMSTREEFMPLAVEVVRRLGDEYRKRLGR